MVSFGRRKLIGIILDLTENSDILQKKLKPVLKILRDSPALDKHLLSVFEFCHHYYHYPLGEIAMNALPPRLRQLKPLAHRKEKNQVIHITKLGKQFDIETLPKKASIKRKLIAALKAKKFLG